MTLPPRSAQQRFINQAGEDLHQKKIEFARQAQIYADATMAADANPTDSAAADTCNIAWLAMLEAVERRNRSQVFLDDIIKSCCKVI